MSYDIITIGDSMRDIFIFPDLQAMEKPLSDDMIEDAAHLRRGEAGFDKFLVFGLGDKITVSDVDFSIGGTAANVAVGLAKMKFKIGIISAIGDDDNGEEILNELKSEKVGTELIKRYRAKNSSFSVIVSYKGERTIFVYHAFAPENFVIPEKLTTSWVYLGPMAKGHERLYDKITAQVVKNDLQVAVNPGAIQIEAGLESFGGLRELINIIFLNREEAQKLSGLSGVPKVKDIAKVIQLRGPQIVVITDGQEGAYVYDGDDFLKVGIYPGHRVDATGAGDGFAAAFLASHILGNDLLTSLKWGVVNSGSVVEKIGAQEGLLSAGSIKKRAKEYRWPAESLRFS